MTNADTPNLAKLPRPKARQPMPARDLAKELAAAAALKDQLKAILRDDGADAQTLTDTIEGETELLETLDAVLAQIGQDEAAIEGIAIFQKALGARKARLEKRTDLMRTMLANALQICEQPKFERPLATLTLKDVPPKLVVTNEADIPAQWWVPQEPTLNRRGLGEALKSRELAISDGLSHLAAERQAGRLDEAGHTALVNKLLADHPAVPGVTLGNGCVTVQVRFS